MTINWLRAETIMRIKMGISWKNRAKPPCLEREKKDEITLADVTTAENCCG